MNKKDFEFRVILVISFFSVLLLLIFFTNLFSEKIKNCSSSMIIVNIPDYDMVQNFCVDKGFSMGWLDSNDCGINQVQCYREINDLKDIKCIDWEV